MPVFSDGFSSGFISFASGGAIGGGSAPVGVVFRNLLTSGGAIGGGSAPVGVFRNVLASPFLFNIGQQPLYWFRVTGCCSNTSPNGDGLGVNGGPKSEFGGCDILGFESNDEKCNKRAGSDVDIPNLNKSTFVQNVLAADLTDVGNYLKSVNWKWPICAIDKFTKPAENKYVTADNDCNKLESVDFSDVPELLDFTLFVDSVSKMSITASLEVIREYEGQAEVVIEFESTYEISGGDFDTGFSGDFDVSYYGSSYYHHGQAEVVIDATSSYEFILDLGYENDISASAALDSIELISQENVDGNNLTAVSAKIATLCGQCVNLEDSLKLNHNLKDSAIFSNFCARNNIVIPNPLPLNYSYRTDSWQSSLHYTGFSNDGSQRESWRLVFDWGCTNLFAGQLADANFWKFSISMLKKNLSNNSDFDTRLLIVFPANNICSNNSDLNFDFRYNTQKLFVKTDEDIVVDNHLLYDNIGLFKSNLWLKKPFLNFNISLNNLSEGFELQDIKPIFPK